MGSKFDVLDDGSVFATGGAGKGSYKIVVSAPAMTLRGVRLEVLADDRLPANGPGRASDGNFTLSQLRVTELSKAYPLDPRRLKFRAAEADFSQEDWGVDGAIDAKPETGWAVDGAQGKDHEAAFVLTRPIEIKGDSQLVFELDHQYDDHHLLGRFRLSVTADEAPLLRPELPEDVRPLAAADAGELSEADEARLREYYLSQDPDYHALKRAEKMVSNPRLAAVQDLAWALINSPAFLFNH